MPFPPLFLVELMREFVNFAASLGVFWGCSAAKSVVQPTIEHTRRTAIIAATNNDNRPLISTLRVLVNSDFQSHPPRFYLCKIVCLACFSRYFVLQVSYKRHVFPLISHFLAVRKRPNRHFFWHNSLLAER